MRRAAATLAGIVTRRPREIALAFLGAALLAGLAAPLEISHRYDDWIDHHSPHYRAYADLRARFGDADTLLAVFARHDLDGTHYAAYAALVDHLAALPGVVAVIDPTRLFLGADASHAPATDDVALFGEALRRRKSDFRHVLVSRELDTLGLLVLADPTSRDTQSALVATLQEGFAAAGIPVELAGTVWFTHELGDAIGRDLARVMTLLALTAALLLRVFLRDMRLVAAVLTGISVSLVYAVSLAGAFGLYLDLLTLLLLPLVIGVGLTTSVHLFTRRRDDRWDYSAALTRILHPAALAALTTAIGCGAFAGAPQPVIARMGYVMPGAVLLTFLTSIVFVPALLAWLAPSHRLPALARRHVQPSVRARQRVSVMLVILAMAALSALPELRTAPDALDFFPGDSSLVRSYRDIEQRLTGLLVADIVITSSDGDDIRARRHAGAVGAFAVRLQELPETTTLVSGYDVEQFTRLTVLAPVESPLRLFSGDSRATRLVLRLRNVAARPWRNIAGDIATAWQATPHAGLEMELTGLIPLILEAQDRLLVIQSHMLPLVLAIISLILLLALRSVRVLLPALLANLLPLLLTAGCMAWFAVPINSINLFVGSVMLGIVVDDTVHLLHAWRTSGSIDMALAEVGQALWITSITVGLAFSTLAVSELVPIRQFGLLSMVAVGSAWLCDTCLLPTLLMQRKGIS